MSAFPEGTTPVCEQLPPGVDALFSGSTVADLSLQGGYYRTSNKSHTIYDCYNKKACKVGIATDDYCATGYNGPCKHAARKKFLAWDCPLALCLPSKSGEEIFRLSSQLSRFVEDILPFFNFFMAGVGVPIV